MSTLDNEFVKFGKTVADVMKHRGKAEDYELLANIGFILLDKEERKGLAAFTKAERNVYAVQGLLREVNNGGWDQFFRNSSGELAFDLIPALEALGSVQNKDMASRALAIFGKPPSLGEVDRATHLTKLTKDGELMPWEKLDSEFYENPEDLEGMMIRYIAANPGEFS